MNRGILDPGISAQDAATSLASISRLRPFLTGTDRSLVFFVGAGASSAGGSGMPSTSHFLSQLLMDALRHSGARTPGHADLAPVLQRVSALTGFEITLNDFWQICPHATSLLFESLAAIDNGCLPNRVHAFLAHWLLTGGTVVTTNYDRLVERALQGVGGTVHSRYRVSGPDSFASWRDDLARGGCLFKIHGSLDDPQTCLGALEHVGTQLVGYRAELLDEVLHSRPLCFVGWRGVDPDVPPVLQRAVNTRPGSMLTFWIHYEGNPPGSVSLQAAEQAVPTPVKPYADPCPILTEADRAFGELLDWVGVESSPNPSRTPPALDFAAAISHCSRSGMTRMLGIVLRRVGLAEAAASLLEAALPLAETPEEQSEVLQEMALLAQQETGRDTEQARVLLTKASESLDDDSELRLRLNVDFGQLSMTIITLNTRPWLLGRVPALFRKYSRDIEALRTAKTDSRSLALHQALLQLYLGRLRFKSLGWLARAIPPLANWVLEPFEAARSTIAAAEDIHLHSHVDVLAYRAVALAALRRCQQAREDLPEIDRLVAVLKDDARARHWQDQRRVIEQHCGPIPTNAPR